MRPKQGAGRARRVLPAAALAVASLLVLAGWHLLQPGGPAARDEGLLREAPSTNPAPSPPDARVAGRPVESAPPVRRESPERGPRPCVVTGRVLRAGGPVSGATVRGLQPAGGGRLARITWEQAGDITGDSGRFRLAPLQPGPVQVQVEACRTGRTDFALAGVSLEPGERRELTIRLGGGRSISGRLLLDSGRPVPGVTVQVSFLEGPPAAAWVVTDTRGAFTMTGLGAGSRRPRNQVLVEPLRGSLEARFQGRKVRVLPARQVPASFGRPLELTVLLEDPPVRHAACRLRVSAHMGWVSLKLKDASGRCLLDRRMSLEAGERVLMRPGPPKADGPFTLDLVGAPGFITVRLQSAGDGLLASVTPAAWRTGLTVSGRITGQPLPELVVLDESPDVPGGGFLRRAPVAADGTFVLEHVPPDLGPVHLVAYDPPLPVPLAGREATPLRVGGSSLDLGLLRAGP